MGALHAASSDCRHTPHRSPAGRTNDAMTTSRSRPSWRAHPWLLVSLLLLSLVAVSQAQAAASLTESATATQNATASERETHAPTPAPFTRKQKEELCKLDHHNYNRVLDKMTVFPKPRVVAETEATDAPAATFPRILCFVNTISLHHESRVQLQAETWGQRCDKLLFFSNATGTAVANNGTEFQVEFPIIKMNAPADYHHLWMKHRESLKYVYDHYRHDYDWFYKADDDAYVVVDNLRDYLRRPEMMMNFKRQPLFLGKRFRLSDKAPNESIHSQELRDRWWKKYDLWIINSGGPGYAMNRLFLDTFVSTMNDKTCLSEEWANTVPDDAALPYCMRWHGVVPWDTRDTHGRPRWHAADPAAEHYMTPEVAKGFWLDFHNDVGGLRWGDDCCAPDSIGYHYVKGPAMYHMERKLYFCRDEDSVDIAAYNRKYGLAISDKVLAPPP